MHAQTLRQYDRLGLVSPSRTRGGGRRYSARDVARLREVQRLSQDEGISLAGIQRILELENQVAALRSRVGELAAELERARAALGHRGRACSPPAGAATSSRSAPVSAPRAPSAGRSPWSSGAPAPDRHRGPGPGRSARPTRPNDSFQSRVERNRLNFGRC